MRQFKKHLAKAHIGVDYGRRNLRPDEGSLIKELNAHCKKTHFRYLWPDCMELPTQ